MPDPITALAGASVLSAGASIISGNKSASAINSASDSTSQATIQTTQMQLDFLKTVRKDIALAVSKGLIDINTGMNMAIKSLSPGKYNAVKDYISIIQNPRQAMNRPGVQFQYQQGLDALQKGFSRTTGGGLSGDIVAAAQQYGQNFAATALDAELNRIKPLLDNATNLANLYSQSGTAKANLRVGGATGTGNIGAQIMPNVANTIMSGANTQAQLGTAGASNFASTIAGVTKPFSDMASLYAIRPDLFARV